MHTKRKTKLLHKERLRTTINCPPQQRMPGFTPLERLCHSDLAGFLSSNREGCWLPAGSPMSTQSVALRYPLPVGSTGAIGQPYSSKAKAELPPAQACRSLHAGTVMIQSLTKRSQRGFGSCGLLRAPPLCGEAPLGLQRSIEALTCGILGPF